MKYLLPATVAAILSFGTFVSAQDNPVVVELFTSQGCSSCPPADAILEELAKRDDVIALALHVDYWDYIGWKDTFGDPAHAQRQRAYAKAGLRRMIYTPEVIVNGETEVVGAKPMKIAKAIADHAKIPRKVSLNLEREGDRLQITAQNLGAVLFPMDIHLLRYAPSVTTEIMRGENKGKTIAYANIVEGWQVLGDWDGQAPLDFNVAVEGDKPAVVIIQKSGAGPIMAAARVN